MDQRLNIAVNCLLMLLIRTDENQTWGRTFLHIIQTVIRYPSGLNCIIIIIIIQMESGYCQSFLKVYKIEFEI